MDTVYIMKTLIHRLLHFFLPLKCRICGDKDRMSSLAGICRGCSRGKFAFRKRKGLCSTCSGILTDAKCEFCTGRNVFFEKLEYIAEKGEFESDLIRRLKFHSSPEIGNLFLFRLGGISGRLKTVSDEWNICYVPSSAKTRRERPYFSFSSVMNFIRKKTGAKTVPALEKKSKELQSGKRFRDRFIHARFSMQIRSRFRNSLSGNFLLIDDVFTTGATLNEAARILMENGAEKIYCIVMLKSFMEEN